MRLFFIVYFLCISTALFAQQRTTVFQAGKEGHASYRIPAIVRLPNGHLLAFAEGRVNGKGDFGDVNIVLKISKDQGKSWGAMQTVVDYDKLQAGNPAPIVDVQDPRYPKGRIFLFYNTGNNHESEVRKGNGLREVWYKTSTDGGDTWTEAVNITTQVHRPKYPKANPDYNFKEDWRAYANTPGHGFQFTKGKYKGRMYIAANHSEGAFKQQAKDYFAHGFYTDDHGKTFKISETIDIPGGNEATAAELSGDGLIFNARDQTGLSKARIVALSKDGGQTWDTAYVDKQLPDPACQGSILNIGEKRGMDILAFCNLADTTKRRDNLTLRISRDGGKTWPVSKVIDKNNLDGKKDNAAYSDLVLINKKKIGILYEKDHYDQIVFTALNWKKN